MCQTEVHAKNLETRNKEGSFSGLNPLKPQETALGLRIATYLNQGQYKKWCVQHKGLENAEKWDLERHFTVVATPRQDRLDPVGIQRFQLLRGVWSLLWVLPCPERIISYSNYV